MSAINTEEPMRHLWTNDTDTYIAERAEDVLDLWEAHNGEPYIGQEEASGWNRVTDWRQIDGGKRVEVGFETWQDAEDQLHEAEAVGCDLHEATVIRRNYGDEFLALEPTGGRVSIDASASWWAQLPSGFLCSTEW